MLFDESSRSMFVESRIYNSISKVDRVGNKLNFRCPVCGDSKKSRLKKRGNYYLATDTFYCFNGGCPCNSSSISGFELLSIIEHVDVSQIKKEFILSFQKSDTSIRDKLLERQNLVIQDVKFNMPKKINVPDNWILLKKDTDVFKKLIEERFILVAPYAPRNWKFYYNKKTKRLVIPWTVYDEILYYQERKIYKQQEPKYLFPFDTKKIVFGIDKIDASFPYIFFTEGCLDSIFVPNCVSIGGIYPTKQQIDFIKSQYNQELVWLPDNPWIDNSTYKKINDIFKINPKQKIFNWDKSLNYKDINDVVISTKNADYFNKKYMIENITTIDKLKFKLNFQK